MALFRYFIRQWALLLSEVLLSMYISYSVSVYMKPLIPRFGKVWILKRKYSGILRKITFLDLIVFVQKLLRRK